MNPTRFQVVENRIQNSDRQVVWTHPEKGVFVVAVFHGGLKETEDSIFLKSVKDFLNLKASDWDATLPFEIRPYLSLAGNVLLNALQFANQQLVEANQKRHFMNQTLVSCVMGYTTGKRLTLSAVGNCSVLVHRLGHESVVIPAATLSYRMNPFQKTPTKAANVPLTTLGNYLTVIPEIREFVLQGNEIWQIEAGEKDSWINFQFSA